MGMLGGDHDIAARDRPLAGTGIRAASWTWRGLVMRWGRALTWHIGIQTILGIWISGTRISGMYIRDTRDSEIPCAHPPFFLNNRLIPARTESSSASLCQRIFRRRDGPMTISPRDLNPIRVGIVD
jgi:hypothetical protein